MDNTTNNIPSSISFMFEQFFSSIDNSVYSALDSISFIDENILNSPYFERLFGTSSMSGILVVANSLLVGFILYYAIKYLLSNFSVGQFQNPYQFFIKVIFLRYLYEWQFFSLQANY